uniref:Uncharacterized protein n=1 Tax=Oreochromis aureus TaxID=47969 RepID=A0AAZ1XWA6_OREAU
ISLNPRIHHVQMREKILQLAREQFPLNYNGKKTIRSPVCSLPQAMWGTQQTCGRRCSGQMRPKWNFLAKMQNAMCGGN